MCHFLRNRTPCHLVPPRLPMAPSRPCLGGARAPFLGPDWGSFFGAGFWPQFWGPKSLHTQCVQPVRPPKLGPVAGPKKRTPFSGPWTALAAGNGAGAGCPPGGGGHGASAGGPFPSEAGPQTGRGAHGGVRPLLLPPSPPGELAEPGCRGGLPPPSQGGPLRALGDPARRGRSLHLASRRQESKLLQRGPCNADVGRGTARSLKNGSPQGRREQGVYPTVR